MTPQQALQLKIKGPRIAIVDVEEQNTTGILFPDNAGRAYVFGQVFALGDNVVAGEKKPHHFGIGDVVVFQANPMMMANCRFEVDGQKFLLILQSDALAKFKNGKAEMSLDSIEMAGEWILCSIEMHSMVGGIHIPDSALKSSPRPPSFRLVKSGPYADVGYPVGTELLIERTRATTMQIGSLRYAYVHKDYCYGAIEG